MTCRVVTVNGVKAIVCGPRPRARKCGHCGAPANLLCDFKVGQVKTCDLPICARCATPGGKDVDFCRDHAEVAIR